MAKGEIFDIVDKDGNIIGEATREEAHTNPELIHRVVHCWIFNQEGQVLMQKRAETKELFPGFWDMSCGGHFSKGEDDTQTLKRELEEELGITEYKSGLVTKMIIAQEKQTELIYLYYAFVNKPASYFKLQEGEVAEIQWMDLKDVFNLKNSIKKVTDWHEIHLPIVLQHLISVR